MTRDELEKLTDYQRRCYNAAQEAGILFVKAIREWRDSIPFASYNGDAYVIGGWMASAFAQKDWDAAFEAFKEGWEEYCQSHKEREDEKPAEPLIKDEKIRKAVRAWAEANGFNADYYEFNIKTLPAGTRFSVGHYDIEFISFFIYDLQTENSYTLAKLCGEEEE